MPSNIILNNQNLNNLTCLTNQAQVRGFIKDQTTLNSTISNGTTGIFIVGFASPSHALLPGLGHGDLIRVTAANAANIFATFAEAPPVIGFTAAGTYNSVFVKTGDLINRWVLVSGAASFSNVDYAISNYSASLILQTGTLTAQRTVTLPAISSTPIGYTIRILDASGSASTSGYIRIVGSGSDTINGNTSSTMPIFISQPYGEAEFTCTASGWICVESRSLTIATIWFPTNSTISSISNLTFGGSIVGNNNVSLGSGYFTGGAASTNSFTVGPGRWRVTANIGARSGSNGYIMTALVNATNTDIGANWATGFFQNTGRATDWSSNFGGWNEFTVVPGSTQQCFFRVWNIGGAITLSTDSTLTVQQVSR